MYLIELTAFAAPRAEGLEVLEPLLLRPDIAHLDHDQRIFVRRPGSKNHVGVKLARRAFDTITEVPQKGGCCRTVEAASHGKSIRKPGTSTTWGEKDELDEIAREDHGDWVSACFVASRDAKGRTTTT